MKSPRTRISTGPTLSSTTVPAASRRMTPRTITESSTARSTTSGLFFGSGRIVAPSSQPTPAAINHKHTHFLPPPETNTSIKNNIPHVTPNLPPNSHQDSSHQTGPLLPPGPPQRRELPYRAQHGLALNPLAAEFFPFAPYISFPDELDEGIDDSADLDSPEHSQGLARVDDLHINEALWSRFNESDDTAPPLPQCDCHNLPRGSCPEFKLYHVDRIKRGLDQTGLTPNMDGLREPLKYPSFPADT